MDEIGVFCHDDNSGVFCSLENFRIFGVTQSEIANMLTFDFESIIDPPRQMRGELSI
jgi:hypothetical protein